MREFPGGVQEFYCLFYEQEDCDLVQHYKVFEADLLAIRQGSRISLHLRKRFSIGKRCPIIWHGLNVIDQCGQFLFRAGRLRGQIVSILEPKLLQLTNRFS